jgi:hypothetical protein
MLKKTAMIVAAAALVMTGAVVLMGNAGQVAACDGKSKTASSKSSACTRSASAAKVSAASTGSSTCTGTKTAGVGTCTRNASAASACCAKAAQTAHYAQVKKAADELPYRINSRVEITGAYECGSCDLGVTDKCQAFIKTADGHLYPLEHNKAVKQMHKMHASGKDNFEITGRVVKQGGAKYVDVTHYVAL